MTPERRHSAAPSGAIAAEALGAEAPRAPRVRRDPGPEREAVAEARVGRVLDVRVEVDEAGREHAAGEIDALRVRVRRGELGRAAPTAAIRSPSTSTAAVARAAAS